MPKSKPSLARFSVSLPADLLDELDDMVALRRFPSRSHAVAEMAREQLLEHAQELGTKSMAGTISLVAVPEPAVATVFAGLIAFGLRRRTKQQ